MVLAAGGLSVCMFFWLGLSRYRNSRTVRLGQPAFCMAFVVSTLPSRRRPPTLPQGRLATSLNPSNSELLLFLWFCIED